MKEREKNNKFNYYNSPTHTQVHVHVHVYTCTYTHRPLYTCTCMGKLTYICAHPQIPLTFISVPNLMKEFPD